MKTFVRTFILMVTLLSIAVPATAQSQQKGIVKTRGTSSVKGSPISGVSIIQRGGSTTVSGKNGSFVLPLTKNSYTLKEVRKAGFSLVDPDILKYEHKYSDEPFPILLEDQQKLRAERNKLERKIERNYRDKYRAKEDSLQNLYDQNKITIEKLNQEMEALEKEKDKIPALTKELTQIRLKLDYDYLNEFDRKFYTYFENEEYGKCDSLINSRGDLQSELNKWHTRDNAITANQERINQEQLIQNKMVEDNTLIGNELADRIYKKFLTFKATLQLDSAAHWIAERAEIGKTNIQWQMDAGDFLSEYRADYDNALKFFNRALELSIELYGEQSYEVIDHYNSIGIVYYSMSNFDMALECFNRILKILDNVSVKDKYQEAKTYYLIGNIYRTMDKDDIALTYYGKAKAINDNLDIKVDGISESFALLYKKQGNLEEALKFILMELEQRKLNTDDDSKYISTYLYIGAIYNEMQDYENSLLYYEESLNICINRYGENHHLAAAIYDYIGSHYRDIGDYQQAQKYFEKALTIYEKYYGEKHSAVASCYESIGFIFDENFMYEEALIYKNKALEINTALFSENSPQVAHNLQAIGNSYHNIDDYDNAIKYYERSQSIIEKIYGKNHSLYVYGLENIASSLSRKGEYDAALISLNDAIDIAEKIYGIDSPKISVLYGNIATIYYLSSNFEEALSCYNKQLNILKSAYGETSVLLCSAYEGLSNVYLYGYNDFDKFMEYSNLLLSNLIKEYGENHIDVARNYIAIASAYSQKSNYKKSIEYFEKAIGALGTEHPFIKNV